MTINEETEDPPRGKHCDDYIHDFSAPHCLRFFLLIHRLPAMDMLLCREFGVRPKLFATYKGARVRVVMASRTAARRTIIATSRTHSGS